MHDNFYDFVCAELEELDKKAKSGNVSLTDVQYADLLEHYKKSVLANEAMESESEYSGAMRDGMMYRDGMRGGSYRGRYEGSYARGRGRNAKRDSMGRYSSEGYSREAADMTAELQDMMDDPKYEPVRHDIERLMRKVEQM